LRKIPNDKLKAPERRCILSGNIAERASLVRLALGPDGQVAPDVRAKAPGRGAWIGVDKATLVAALKKGKLRGALSRAFKTGQLEISESLPDDIERALRRGTMDRLGLEARAGLLVNGGEKIETAARKGRVHLLLHASDAAEDGNRKLDQAYRIGMDEEGSGKCGMILPVDRDALSMAMGRQNVVHAALTDKKAAARVEDMLARWLNFLGPEFKGQRNERHKSGSDTNQAEPMGEAPLKSEAPVGVEDNIEEVKD